MKKLIIVVNVDWFFLSHRLPIAVEALRRGYDVIIMAIEEDGRGEEIRSYGLRFIPMPSSRGGKNLIEDLKLMLFLNKVYKRENPDIVHHVAIKPVLYGSIVARINRIPKIVNAISGLGSAFIDPNKWSVTYWIVKLLYKFSLRSKNIIVIVQNRDDENLIRGFCSLLDSQLFLIKGSGVDLTKYNYMIEPIKGPIRVVLVSRMLVDKGVREFEQTAKILKRKYNDNVDFVLAGKVDYENSTFISIEQLKEWSDQGHVCWVGFVENIAKLYEQSHIAVLPSYREGLPKSLIEAMAVGRPIVTTNVPGCREVVDHGVNGFLVRERSVEDLVIAVSNLIENSSLRQKMGEESRKLVEKEFTLKIVLRKTFELYESE